jgi:carbon starvation protein CstA
MVDTSPQAVARRARIEKWFWAANLPVCVLMWYLAYITEIKLVEGIMILYLALVSVHALVKTCATEEQAAEARQTPSEPPPP